MCPEEEEDCVLVNKYPISIINTNKQNQRILNTNGQYTYEIIFSLIPVLQNWKMIFPLLCIDCCDVIYLGPCDVEMGTYGYIDKYQWSYSLQFHFL